MSDRCSSALAVPFLGVLASLQLIDPVVANTALVKASQSLEMHGATLALAASISTLAQAATVLLLGFLGDRLRRRQVQGLLKVFPSRDPAQSLTAFSRRHPASDPCQRHPSRALLQPWT